jgi:hypothetical protein
MSKFISIPLCGTASAGTLPVPGNYTANSAGVITAVALGTAGTIQTVAPIINILPSDGRGSGAVIIPVYAAGIIASYTVVNGGSGYTETTTGSTSATWPPFLLNAEKVISITYGAVSGTASATNTLLVTIDRATATTLTLTFASNTAAATTDGGFAVRSAIINGLMFANNVKNVEQVTPVIMPNGALLLSAVYS